LRPFISVIIPTYNRAHTLRRALDSVLNQSYRNFECLVVDDGSIDDTRKVISEYQDERVTYLYSENKGVSSARNIGFQHSRGEWISLLDSDDEWLIHKLEEQVKFIEKNNHYKIVHGEEVWIRSGKRVNPKKIHKKSGGRIFERCLKLCLISPSTVIISRNLWSEYGGFNEDFVVCEDYDLWLKITAKYEVGYIERPLIVKYGGHDDQLSQKYRAMDYWRVKSLTNVLKEGLTPQYQLAVACEIVRKGDILINGYKKHQNFEYLHEVEDMVKKGKMLVENMLEES